MATDPLALQPIETPVPQEPGFFDGTAGLNFAPQMDQPLDPVGTEETQVAGMGRLAKELITPFDKRKGHTPTEPVERAAGDADAMALSKRTIVVRDATDNDIKEWKEITGKTRGVPSPSAGQKAAGIPVADVNLERIEAPEDIKRVIDSIAQMHKSTGPITHASVINDAKGLGLEETVEKLLTRKEGDAIDFSLPEIKKALDAITSSSLNLNRLAEKARAPTSSREDLIKFRQYFAFHSALQHHMQGLQADVGRALGIFRTPRGPDAKQVENLQAMLNDFGGEDDVRDMADKFLELPTQAQKNEFARKGGVVKFKDAWFEIWINGLLSGPQTQVVNIASNSLFSWMQPFERLVAGGIGAARRGARSVGITPKSITKFLLFGRELNLRLTMKDLSSNPETVFAGESADMLGSWVSATIDGFRIGYKAFKTETPQFDALEKIESANQRAITAQRFGLDKHGALGASVEMIGVGARLSGRSLMATDETFKAATYRIELNAQIQRRARQMALDGKTAKEIEDFRIASFKNPPDDIHARSEEMARINTFTNSIPQWADSMRNLVHTIPLGRYVLPFFRVIYNITDQTLQRTPVGLIHAIRATDPVQRDLAYAKIATGSAMMGTAAYFADQGNLTGTGPSNFDLRRQMEEMGWKPYSIVKAKPGVENPRWVQVGQVSFLHPEDVNYYSYHRLEPASMLLALATDMHQRFAYPDATIVETEQLAMQGVDAVYKYMKDQTFMTGFANAMELLTSHGNPAKGDLQALKGVVSTQIPYATLVSNIANVTKGDEAKRSTATDPEGIFVLRDIYAGLQKMDERTPFSLGMSKDMPLARNAFYEPLYTKKPRIVDNILPPFISQTIGGPDIATDDVKMELLRLAVPLARPAKSYKGVRLTPQEMDDVNRLTNYPEARMGDNKALPSLYDVLKDQMKQDSYWELPYPEQQKEIRNIIDGRRLQAVRWMLNPENTQWADFQKRAERLKDLLEEYGNQVK